VLLQTESSHTAQVASTASSFWSALPGLLWFLLGALGLLLLRRQLIGLLENLAWRLRTGTAVKLFSLELGQTYVAPNIVSATNETNFEHYEDKQTVRWKQRENYYVPNRNLHLVHRIAPSRQEGMLYDVEIYLVPHKGATLANVTRVEYYFGKHWGNQIFVSIDRARSFAISTSAYGAFMCTAELFFSDGERVFVNRYVDFEMGGVGSKL
jgi:pYEATS domain-containing protein involved in immunity